MAANHSECIYRCLYRERCIERDELNIIIRYDTIRHDYTQIIPPNWSKWTSASTACMTETLCM